MQIKILPINNQSNRFYSKRPSTVEGILTQVKKDVDKNIVGYFNQPPLLVIAVLRVTTEGPEEIHQFKNL